MKLSPGTHLGLYELASPLGAGVPPALSGPTSEAAIFIRTNRPRFDTPHPASCAADDSGAWYSRHVGSGLIEQVASGEAPPLVPLTVEQLHGMLEKGIIRDGDPIELVEGLLVRKNRAAAGEDAMTHGAGHAQVVTRLVRLERALDPLGCHLRVQLPVTLSALSEPEPDLAIVKGSLESFAERHPGPEDVLVLVEVADSSLGYDRGAKLRVYASAGVPVYLIVNIPERQVECYEEPVAGQGRYQRRTDYRPGETLLLPLVGGRTLPMAVDDAFGPASR